MAYLRPSYTRPEIGGVNLTVAFAMLRDLGENKFNALQHELARTLARTIRKQLENIQDSSDTLLAMQLRRLPKDMALGKMGKQIHVTIEADRKRIFSASKSPNLDVLQELVALTKVQSIRVQVLWEKEIASNKP
jgi:hypothetical protein